MATYNLNQDKVNFSYYNYSKGILFDEKKKRFVDFSDMDLDTYLNYRRTFTNVLLINLNENYTKKLHNTYTKISITFHKDNFKTTSA